MRRNIIQLRTDYSNTVVFSFYFVCFIVIYLFSVGHSSQKSSVDFTKCCTPNDTNLVTLRLNRPGAARYSVTNVVPVNVPSHVFCQYRKSTRPPFILEATNSLHCETDTMRYMKKNVSKVGPPENTELLPYLLWAGVILWNRNTRNRWYSCSFETYSVVGMNRIVFRLFCP